MYHIIFKRVVVAFIITAMVVNPALAQQPTSKLIKQNEQQLRYTSKNKIAAAPVATAIISSIQVDLAAEQARQAGIKQASNGTTVVDISAPTAGGVSHNLFSEFNVDNNGLILNNSAAPVLTQLGGWTDGNRRLAGGQASIILNEVTSNSRSNLFGHIEIAGRSAEFVLANPNGITCDGCGFINTPRVTLATGRAALQGGSLSGFNVSGGDFRLDGKGLNAANVDRFDILARAASINAQLYAQQLNVITGVNSVDYNTGTVAANGAAASPGFQIALDTSSLGAMYANSIRLVGTEQGMGVNSQGLIQSVNDLELSADGNIVIKNAQANNTIQLQSRSGSIETLGHVYAKSLQFDAKDTIENHGLLGAASGIGLNGESFIQRGNFYAGLGTDGQLNSAGYVQGKIADRLENYGTFYVGGEFSLESANLTNDQGQVIFQTAESLQLSGDFTNKGLLQFNTPNASVVATNIDNSSGQIQIAEGGSLGIIASEGFKNAQGVVKVDELQVQAHTLDNSNGILSALDTVLTANQLVNNQGDVRAETLTVTATSLQNQQGLLLATGAEADSLRVDVEGNLDNSAGTIFANADTRLTLGSLNNSQGNIQVSQGAGLHIHASNLIQNRDGNISAHNLQLDAADLYNDTGILLANGLTLDIAQLLSNSGQIQAQQINLSALDYLAQGGVLLAQGTADNSLTLAVSNSIRNTQGSIIETAGESLKIDAQSLTNDNSQITVLGEGELNVRVGELNNQSGQLAATDSIAINAATVRNSDGAIHSRQLHLTTDRLDNTAGVVTGKDQLSINTDTLINNGGLLGTDAGYVSLDLGTLDNRNGKILHAGQGLFSLTLNDLLNAGGSIQSNSNLVIGAATISNTSGTIAADQLTLSANQLDNNAGTLLGVTQLGVTAAGLNNRSGSLQGRAVNVSAQSLNNQQGAITASGSGLVIDASGDINNQQGIINSGQQLSITTSLLDNNGGTVNGLDLALTLDRLSNIAGLLQGGQIDLSVPQLDNTDGTISATSASGSGLRLNVSGDLNNTRGTVFAQGNAMTINAANVHNTRGKILYTGSGVASITGAVLNNNQGNIDSNGDLKLVATTLQNQQGLISAAGNAHIQASDLIDNSQGKLMAAGAQTLDSEQLINTNGIVSADQLAITSTHIDNLGTGFIEANKLILDTDRLLNEGHLLAAGNANNSLEFNVKTFINSGRLEANSENLLLDGVDMESMGGEIIHGGTGVLHIRHTGEFNNRDGILASQGTIRLDADSLDNRGGELLAEKQLQVSLSALNNQAGVIQTGDGLSLNLQDLDNSNGGKLIISGVSPSELNIAAGLDNNNGSIIYWGTDRLQINAATIDNTNQGLIGGSGAILLAANQLDNTQGNLIGDSQLDVNVTRLLNQDGRIESAQLAFNLDELHNSGSILARDTASDSLVINIQRLLNTGTIESRGINFTLANTGLDNTSGVILHRGNGALAIEQLGLVNQGGLIQGAGDVRLNLDSLDNLGAGEIVAANNLQLNVQQLTNDGLLQAGNAITFNTRQLDNLAQGQVAALGDSLVLNTRAINNQGVLTAQRQLSLNSDQLDNGATGIIQSNGQLDVVVDSLVNSGFIAADQLGLNAQQLTNNAPGRIQAASGLLQGYRWVNDGLVLIHSQHADSQVQLSELRNQGTVEIHSNNADVTLGTLVNSGGEFIAIGAGRLSLDALDIDNQQGHLAARNLQLTANQINNNEGEIIGDTLNLDAQVINNHAGHLQANAQLTLKADQLDNRNDGLVLSSGAGLSSLDLGYLDNRAGTLAINHLELQATHIDNRAGELIADDLLLRADALDNTQGAIATTANGSDDNLQITIASTLKNSQGLIQGGGKNSAITAGELRNS